MSVLMLSLLISPALAQTRVENNVSVSAETGGNSADGGVITNGNAKAEVSSETVINGEVVESIEKVVESATGDVFIEYSSVVESENGEETVSSETVTSEEGEAEVEAQADVEAEGGTGPQASFLTRIFLGIKSFFFNVFRTLFA